MKGKKKAQQWEEYSTVENQQERILQANTFPRQLIVKEERQGEHEKTFKCHSFLDHRNLSYNELECTSKIHEVHGISS